MVSRPYILQRCGRHYRLRCCERQGQEYGRNLSRLGILGLPRLVFLSSPAMNPVGVLRTTCSMCKDKDLSFRRPERFSELALNDSASVDLLQASSLHVVALPLFVSNVKLERIPSDADNSGSVLQLSRCPPHLLAFCKPCCPDSLTNVVLVAPVD